jgi:fermentation-respiration switch protein FrsA (DUF1100 family)
MSCPAGRALGSVKGVVRQSARELPSVRVRPTATALAEDGNDPEYFLPEDPGNLLQADPARRSPVGFASGGATLGGHLYRPPGLGESERTPAVALCGPISSVKEQTLPHYAERLADAGYTALTFDPRSFGESEGEPRDHHDPSLVIEDYANAVSYLMTRDDVDPDSVAVVGVCMGGGYAVSTAARDKRLKAVVSIAGGYNIGGTFQQFLGVDGFAAYLRKVHAPLVAPTPLLIVHGTTDAQLLPEFAQEAYDAALDPKELVWIEAHNHIQFYDQDPYVSEAAAHTIRWLDRYVGGK